MLQKILGDSTNKCDFFLVFGLLFNVFTWHLFSYKLIEKIIFDVKLEEHALLIWASFYLPIILFSIIGAIVSKKFSRTKFLQFWIVFGVIASLFPALINDFNVTNLAVACTILGASFGLGMPTCLAFFAETTKVDNRGRVAAITFLVASLVGPLLSVTFVDLSFSTIFIICAIWRGTGLIAYATKPSKHDSPEEIKTSFVSILRSREFLLYFGAWAMFSLVNAMETPIVIRALGGPKDPLVGTMETIEPIFALFFILIAGFLCDWIGRKKVVLSGFVSLGAAYAIIGFLPDLLGDIVWYLYFVVDGAAWGIFYITFVFILWGDLSQQANKEKYYALGSIPFFLSEIISHSFVVGEIQDGLPFSVAAFFLFLAVLPLISAPETLPEKNIELRRLRSFADEARKAKEKYERKSGK